MKNIDYNLTATKKSKVKNFANEQEVKKLEKQIINDEKMKIVHIKLFFALTFLLIFFTILNVFI